MSNNAVTRQTFLDMIEKDPYDLGTRKIFADWLDEYGTDADAELAVEQRAWTREKQDSIVWMTEFAASIKDGYSGDDECRSTYSPSYDKVLKAAMSYLDDPKHGRDIYL